jgi:hypothetical protein
MVARFICSYQLHYLIYHAVNPFCFGSISESWARVSSLPGNVLGTAWGAFANDFSIFYDWQEVAPSLRQYPVKLAIEYSVEQTYIVLEWDFSPTFVTHRFSLLFLLNPRNLTLKIKTYKNTTSLRYGQ